MPPANKRPAKKQASKKQSPKKQAPKRSSSRGSRPTRAQRAEARRRRREMRGLLVRAAVIVVVVGVVAGLLLIRGGGAGPGGLPEEVAESDCSFDEEYDGSAAEQSGHVPSPTYEVNPPAGGAHEAAAASPGFYESVAEAPSDGQLVHAMEHGFVVLWFDPILPDDEKQQIADLSDRFGRELIVVARPHLPDGVRVAATAWHRRLLCPSVDPAAIAAFTEAYKDQGPEKGFL